MATQDDQCFKIFNIIPQQYTQVTRTEIGKPEDQR